MTSASPQALIQIQIHHNRSSLFNPNLLFLPSKNLPQLLFIYTNMADKMDRGLDEIIADTVSSCHTIWLLFFYAISRCSHALLSCLDHSS